ncbi:MAG TPA: acyl-CoA dehydrogenase family protein, partial [Xanthomonadales bacterium]|nr:acyl-CoA dehydrogenase family protein [Xanthomonadales bacterium]
MRVNLDSTAAAWADKARRFAEEELIPCEIEAEMNGGRLPGDISKRHKKMAIELGFSSMDVPKAYGGLQLRNVDQVAVWEQLGRVTNALCWCFSEPHQWMFDACSEDQLQRFVLPLMRGERKECYAITEAESGSDVVIETTAERTAEGYRLNGEKWFVTTYNLADFLFVQAKLVNGPHAGEDAMFLVDKDTPGI